MRLEIRLLALFTVSVSIMGVTSAEDVHQDIAAATQACEQNATARDMGARQMCVEKLAQIADRLIGRYRENGERNDEAMTEINAELKKHPLPADSDSRKLTKFLIGKWDSPRHTYIFNANGKYGVEDGSINRSWQIKGNQLIENDSRGTIILLNSKYFIYAEGDGVFFHSRAKDGD